jgi:hypothetical protein
MATECPRQLTFWKIGRQQVTTSPDGGRVVSDAGLIPLRNFEKQLGVLADLAQRLPDPRAPKFIIHSQEAILTQQIYQILAGYGVPDAILPTLERRKNEGEQTVPEVDVSKGIELLRKHGLDNLADQIESGRNVATEAVASAPDERQDATVDDTSVEDEDDEDLDEDEDEVEDEEDESEEEDDEDLEDEEEDDDE